MAAEISSVICFSSEELKFTTLNDYDIVSMLPYDFIGEPGKPNLPARNVYIAVPAEARVVEVRVTSSTHEDLPGYYNIHPAQPFLPTSKSADIEFVPPDPLVYNLSTPYPNKLIEYTGTGCMGGQKLVSIRVYPVQYIPKEKRLRFYTRIEFAIDYDLTGTSPLQRSKFSNKAINLYKQMLEKIVLNPENIQTPQPLNPDSVFEYLIITDDEYVPIFKELTEWKTRKGIPAQIRTVSWITANYSGWDDAEKIRNYLKEAYTDSGLVWVLLGGDTDKVPYREAYVQADDAGGEIDYAPCDLYFSDLDDTWDANENHIYGELADNVDMYPDVFVGRTPVNTTDEAQIFVNKVLTYELNPPLEDYPLRMLFMAYDLDGMTPSEQAKNMIDNAYVPARFDPITKLYDSNGGWGPANAINALNEGYNIVNHSDHCDWWVMGVGWYHHYTGLSSSSMDALTNGNQQSILYSIGCWPAAFDYDAVSEHFVNNPNGGGLAFIGNSRYGWYMSGWPLSGPSHRYDQAFFSSLFQDNCYQIGLTHANAKIYYIGDSQSYDSMRWCQFVLNVLGPVEMPIWTDTPDTLSVEHLPIVALGQSEFTVDVTYEGAAVENALVCVMDSTVYEYDYTNANGLAVLSISPIILDTMWVTVTMQNYLPYESYALIISDEPYISYLTHSINDTAQGNGDGIVNPCEYIEMPLWVKNWGMEAADSVSGMLTTDDPYVNIYDTIKTFGHIEPGDSAFTGWNGYNFEVSINCPDNHWITFDLTCTDALDSTWISHPMIMVAAPVLSYSSYSMNDSISGNGNGIAEPDETVDMNVSLKNWGSAIAENVYAVLATDDPFITINLDSVSFDNIGVGDSVVAFTPYNIYIEPLCPDPHYPVFALEIMGNNCISMDSFSINIGTGGFFDDMEEPDIEWTHYPVTPGHQDDWHISDTRSYSATHSWKYGDTGAGNYHNYGDGGLVTRPIIIAPTNPCLRFWHWIEAETSSPTAAIDGTIVEISCDGNIWQQITPIGGYPYTINPDPGNPLPDNTPCFSGFNEWQQEEFDLSEYAGETVQIRFRFASNGYIGYEGWYIDDVWISGMPDVGVDEEIIQAGIPEGFSLLQNFPNPLHPQTTISYSLPKSCKVSLKIYNIKGQLVETLVNDVQQPGYHSVIWNAEDARSGIYLYRITAGDFTNTRKCVILK